MTGNEPDGSVPGPSNAASAAGVLHAVDGAGHDLRQVRLEARRVSDRRGPAVVADYEQAGRPFDPVAVAGVVFVRLIGTACTPCADRQGQGPGRE